MLTRAPSPAPLTEKEKEKVTAADKIYAGKCHVGFEVNFLEQLLKGLKKK